MARSKLKLSSVVDRGDALFESTIKPLVKDMNPEHFIAIDVKSGKFAVAADRIDAVDSPGSARRPVAIS